MIKKYNINEGHFAVLVALSATLNSDTEGMRATNQARLANGNSVAYEDDSFYLSAAPLREYLESLEVGS